MKTAARLCASTTTAPAALGYDAAADMIDSKVVRINHGAVDIKTEHLAGSEEVDPEQDQPAQSWLDLVVLSPVRIWIPLVHET